MHPLLIVLVVFLSLLMLLLSLLLFGTAKLRITYTTKKPRAVLSVLGIPVKKLGQTKSEEAAVKNLSRCRNPEKVLRRELERQKKLAAKAEKKKRREAQKAAEKARKKKEKKARASKQPSPNLLDNLEMILAFLKRFYDITNGKMKVNVKRFRISVATGDAAMTAMLYGAVIGPVAAIIELIDRSYCRINRKAGDMQVRVDYLSSKPSAEIDIVCSVPLYRLLTIGVSTIFAWKNERAVTLKNARDRQKELNADEA